MGGTAAHTTLRRRAAHRRDESRDKKGKKGPKSQSKDRKEIERERMHHQTIHRGHKSRPLTLILLPKTNMEVAMKEDRCPLGKLAACFLHL